VQFSISSIHNGWWQKVTIAIYHLNLLRWLKNKQPNKNSDWLILTVLRPAQEFFTCMETSPLPVKGCKIWAYARRSGPLSREGALSCHTCCDKGPRFFRSHPKDRPNQSPLSTHMGMWRIYSNPLLSISKYDQFI
jgi:hypothetical protein